MEGGGLERSTYPKLRAIESGKWEKQERDREPAYIRPILNLHSI